MEYNYDIIAMSVSNGFALAFAVPFHILLIVVLVKYRKSTDFQFPFFRLLLSLSINDLVAAVLLSIVFLSLLLSPKTLVDYTQPLNRIIADGVFAGGLGGDIIVLIAIGINRLIAYVFPLQSIWHPIHTKCAIAIQWIYFVSFAFAHLHPDMHGNYYVNETTGILMLTVEESLMYMTKSLINFIMTMTGGLTLAIVYSVCVAKLVHHKLTMTIGQDSNNWSAEVRLTFQGVFLSSSLIVVSVLYGYATFKCCCL